MPPGVLDDVDRVDQESLAFELAWAARVSAPVRAAVARLTTLLLAESMKRQDENGNLSPQAQAAIRAAANAAIALLSVQIAAQVTSAVAAAVALATRQESAALAELGIDASRLRVTLTDPVLLGAGAGAQQSLGRAVTDIRRFAGAAPLATAADVQALAGKAATAVTAVESSVRYVTNRAINQTTVALVVEAAKARPPRARTPLGPGAASPVTPDGRVVVEPGLRVVWVAERGACLTCLALSGNVIDPNSGHGFDEFATFSPHGAPSVWPPGRPLMAPPRHPNCRCRLRIITADNTLVPQALRREAERSVLRGWSDYDSRVARLTAADRLLHHGTGLPRTVKERAARDVRHGRFNTRHKPRTHLRAD